MAKKSARTTGKKRVAKKPAPVRVSRTKRRAAATRKVNGGARHGATRKKTVKKKTTRKKVAKKPVGTCFVLMPFKEPFESYYSSIIEPAIKVARLDPQRGDSLFRPSPIMGDIWKMIQDTEVVVAELTTRSANVFYELGLAHAIGKPVVLLSETMEDVPFDLQPLRVILYHKTNPEWGKKLRSDIANALTETLREPVAAVPPMFRKKVKSQAPAESDVSLRVSALERKLAALAPAVSDRSELAVTSPESLHEALRNTRDLERQVNAVLAARIAMPSTLVRDVLRIALPPERVKKILRFTGL